MSIPRSSRMLLALIVSFAALSSLTGCALHRGAVMDVPTELAKVNIPEHIIAPPDILQIDATLVVPPKYLIRPDDMLAIQAQVIRKIDKIEDGKGDKRFSTELIPGQPLEGTYRVEKDGAVNLKFEYGSVKVSGLTLADAENAIKKHLSKRFVNFELFVALDEPQLPPLQQIRGEHLVEPDGKITLGTYGTVNVTGLTLDQARAAIQTQVAAFLSDRGIRRDPEISLTIVGFNSRVYYVLFDLDGAGQQVYRRPITGNETVLDAVADLNGLPGGTARWRIWLARPSMADSGCGHVLPVDWHKISSCASTATNYQLLPGDRLYVGVDPWVRADNFLAKTLSPLERILGITLLGNTTVRSFTDRQGQGLGSGVP